jgi:N-sulfoglucosamine sulfohydrolase
MPRPNILYIHSHDTGRYIAPYGYDVPTPNLQRLAQEGVVFRQAFSVAPTCSPSRAGLLTGQSAHASGMIGLAHRGFALTDYRQHLVHALHNVGYPSALIGVQHIARRPDVIGYDEVVPVESNRAEHVAPAAVQWLRGAPQEPFFLSVGFTETHREFHQPGPGEDPRYLRPPATLRDTPAVRADMAAFHASARVLDGAMGAVLDALRETGLEANTLVICTTDHGIAFPGAKCTLTDHGIGVMLIMRGPGGFAGGLVCDALVSHVDIFPTLCELLEIERPSWLRGNSLMPLIRGEAEEVNDAIYAEVTYHAAYEPMRAVRTQRWKYIRRFGGRLRPVLPNCDDSPSKTLWLKHGWRERDLPEEELYDLAFDPNEACNVAGRPELAAALEEMRARLDRWMRATDDPLLHGPVPAPRGAQVNDPDGLSPREPVHVVT